jgi:hypothetical protein
MSRAVLGALAAVLALSFAPAADAAPQEVLTPVVANVITPPQPVLTSDGRRQLAYELQLINRSSATATVRNIRALGGGRVLQSLSGSRLRTVMAPYGQSQHALSLRGGQGAFVLMDVSLPRSARVPARLTHRLTVSLKPRDPVVSTTYATAPTRVVRREAVVVAPPLRGSNWLVGNGCCADFTAHRGTVLPVNGGAHVPERYAIDFVRIGAGDLLFNGPREALTSYPFFGDEIHSATTGKVVGVVDNLPETVPVGSLPKGITAAEAGGNHVVVAMGHGRFAFYAHMQPGSIRVKVGDVVTVGQTLGLLGNSGNTDAPHLHFHVMDGPLPLASNGVPFRFSTFTVQGQMTTNDEAFLAGTPATIAPRGAGPRTNELPLNDQVIAFPDA